MTERASVPVPRSAEHGFTLVELLVALLIFGALSAAGVALLSFSVQAQAATDERIGALADLRRAGALLASDLAQAAPRVARDEEGRVRPAFQGDGGAGDVALAFVRRGWDNPDAAPRPSLQKVEYRLNEGRLERRAHPYLDGAKPLPPIVLLEGVTEARFRYRDPAGEWRERWDPVEPDDLPRAVELVLTLEEGGDVRQLFLTGAGA